ncbi:MAG: IS200/IS605 family transposase [Capsulimonas sp.]|uniref:IS200/IS605 family transposase n=1 Tax=Capsulimonas sp. TaxID=2494211 RepID=UPI003267C161
MRNHKAEVYIHLVWATWDREPMIRDEDCVRLYGFIREEAAQMRAEVVAIGGTNDHIHILTELPATISISDFVKRLKGGSSHFVNHLLKPDYLFRWQGAYGVFSVSTSDCPQVQAYVMRQREHHRVEALNEGLELMGE